MEIYDYFNNVPMSINNLYGDPFIQKENTYAKLQELKDVQHKGIISIITKTEITEEDAIRLKHYQESLNLIILVSISGLPYEIEKIKSDRYNTLSLCSRYHIPCIAYIRPFIPNYNTSEDVINSMFDRISNTGCKNIVVAGLRGNDNILANSKIKEEEIDKWSLRVKIIPKDVRSHIENNKHRHPELKVFERTSCAVSYVLGKERSYNPYWFSPQLAKCNECALIESCYRKQDSFTVNEHDIELANFLGYDVEHVNIGDFPMCKTIPEKRTECISCCTGCFILERDAMEIKPFNNITLGDVSLLRLLTSKHVFCKNVIDSGASDVARPQNPYLQDYNLYLLNSWWSYSNNIKKCYGCTYCIVPTYKNDEHEYGILPEKLYDLLKKRRG